MNSYNKIYSGENVLIYFGTYKKSSDLLVVICEYLEIQFTVLSYLLGTCKWKITCIKIIIKRPQLRCNNVISKTLNVHSYAHFGMVLRLKQFIGNVLLPVVMVGTGFTVDFFLYFP